MVFKGSSADVIRHTDVERAVPAARHDVDAFGIKRLRLDGPLLRAMTPGECLLARPDDAMHEGNFVEREAAILERRIERAQFDALRGVA
jgi:hypothetical protein